MRERQLVAIPCDKEFGFCLETLEAHSVVQMDILMGDAYQDVAVQTVNNHELFERYAKAVICISTCWIKVQTSIMKL